MIRRNILIALLIFMVNMMIATSLYSQSSSVYKESGCGVDYEGEVLSISASTEYYASTRSLSIDKRYHSARIVLGLNDRKGFVRDTKDIKTINFESINELEYIMSVAFDEKYLEGLDDSFLVELLKKWEFGVVSMSCKSLVEDFLAVEGIKTVTSGGQ